MPTRGKSKDPLDLARRTGLEDAVREVLVGEPLREIRRVVTMVCLGFGRRRWHTNRHGKRVLLAEYALHTESSWRLLGPDGLITGKADMNLTRDEPPRYPEDEMETWGGSGNTATSGWRGSIRCSPRGGSSSATSPSPAGSCSISTSGRGTRFGSLPRPPTGNTGVSSAPDAAPSSSGPAESSDPAPGAP